jgi:hypothetical protein
MKAFKAFGDDQQPQVPAQILSVRLFYLHEYKARPNLGLSSEVTGLTAQHVCTACYASMRHSLSQSPDTAGIPS